MGDRRGQAHFSTCGDAGTPTSQPSLHQQFRQEAEKLASSVSYSAAPNIRGTAQNMMDVHAYAVSDAESDESSSHAGHQAKRQGTSSSPSLDSLQTQRLPAIPDEQDRKRFVGCLAAVLASTYDYEELDLADDELSRAETLAYLAASADDDESNEDADASAPKVYSSTHDDVEVPDRRSVRYASSEGSSCGVSEHAGTDDERRCQARTRYRKRRYDILSRLLLSCSELLLLEKGQVKAFLPILSKLLIPNNHRSFGSRHRTKTHTRSARAASMPSRPEHNDPAGAKGDPESVYSAAIHSFSGVGSDDIFTHQLNRIEHLRPFLESLTPGSGFRCLAMFLLQHLLTSQVGYDARVRHALKTLGVLVLLHDEMSIDSTDSQASGNTSTLPPNRTFGTKSSQIDRLEETTRKFEALEVAIASKLIILSREQNGPPRVKRHARRKGKGDTQSLQPTGPTREEVMRGLKVGGTAILAGTLFAVTGGLAAPGIAAGMGMLMGGTAVTAAAAAVLTSTAAVTTIFGVGGGGLAAYKMHRRTEGLTEFEFTKEPTYQFGGREAALRGEGDLFSTIAISGWLRDEHDFQRPWGVSPSNPRLRDRLELLERFYSIHRPDHVGKCRKILQNWDGDEKGLWLLLKERYGKDPDHLFPLETGPRLQSSLTLEEEEIITELLVELDYMDPHREVQSTPFERLQNKWRYRGREQTQYRPPPTAETIGGLRAQSESHAKPSPSALLQAMSEPEDDRSESKDRPKHLATVWSYTETYGGELYTVKWESELMMELCDSVNDLALDIVTGSTAQVLKHTALATLMTAIAWPYALVSAANLIDGTWTLAVERADMAGKELARSLLFSKAGHRPMTLVGYSFGARVIYSCLKELSLYQAQWEAFQSAGRPPQSLDGYSSSYDREPASIVEDAILLGLPNHLSASSWKACRQVVAGRLVNCFSQKDMILSLMFQFKRLGLKRVCGTCPVNVDGVENFDVTDLVQGHQDYCLATGSILKRIRFSQPFSSRPTQLFVPHSIGSTAADT
jgi:hypothetical protein